MCIEVIYMYALSRVEIHVWMMWIPSFTKEPYTRDNILQKRPIILRSLRIVATPYMYGWCAFYQNIVSFIGLFCKRDLSFNRACYRSTRVRSSLSCEIDTERYCRLIVCMCDVCTYTYKCMYICTYR